MKTFLKSFALGVLMLLAVQLKAENKPEKLIPTNPEVATTMVTVEPDDVQKPKCFVNITICGQTHTIYAGSFGGNDCKEIQSTVDVISILVQALTSCD